MRGGRNNMADKPTEPQEEAAQEQQIDIENLTTEQAFNILTGAVRSQPFTYIEHVQLEQARVAVANAVAGTDGG